MIRLGVVLAIAASTAPAQSFEVVSIHPADPKVRGVAGLCENGRLTIYSTTLRELIQVAWKVRDVEIAGGPGWIDSAHYYGSAKGAGNASDSECRTMTQISIGNLALMLSRSMDHPVLDRTGLTLRYTFTLEWTPESADGAGPSIFTAVEEQLGLKLENQKAPVDVRVIDRAEKSSEN